MTRWISVHACCVFWLCVCSTQGGVRERDMVLVNPQPLGIRGGVLMVKLASTGDTSGWPETIDLRLNNHGDEQEIKATLAWIGPPASRPTVRPWSWGGSDSLARPITPADDPTAVSIDDRVSGVYLLAQLPEDAAGVLILGRRTYTPRWLHLPRTLPVLSVGAQGRSSRTMKATSSPAHPAVEDPFTWWRWTLLAHRLGMQPPAPPDANMVEQLVAEHIAQLWRIGITRLATESRGVAARCRDLLTETCHDGDVEFATWITEPDEVFDLLSLLLEQGPARTLVNNALAWADRQIAEVAWVEQGFGNQVQLALANPDPKPHVVELIWSGIEGVPLGDQLTPSQVTRVTLERPRSSLASALYPELGVGDVSLLNVVIHDHALTLAFGPATISVKPPGALLGPFRNPITLSELRSGWSEPVPLERVTHAQLRYMGRRWELFIECARPVESTNRRVSTHVRSLKELQGHEAVTVLIGSPTTERAPARHVICIPEKQEPIILVGPREDTPEVHVRSYADRWLVRFVLPRYWMPPDGEPLQLALIRTHGDSMGFETAPNPCVPWRMRPDMVQLDLSEWEDGGPHVKTRHSGR